MERIFTEIYRSNAWGSAESASGPGSTRKSTAALREALAAAFRELQVRVLLDAPCGDFNWIEPIADVMDHYIGVDIVPELVAKNLRRHAGPRRTFVKLDLSQDSLPRSDAVLCRDCLIHFSVADAERALANLRRSGARYLVTTTFVGGERVNADIETGQWRPLNLQRPPFSFPQPLRLIDERCLHTKGIYADKRLGIWPMADVPA